MKYLNLFEEFKIRKLQKVSRQIGADEHSGIKEVVKKFKKPHNPILEDIIESLVDKFKLKGKVKYLNSGSFGMAFAIDDKVIKLTSSKSEALVAKKLIPEKIPHCINYYNVVYMKRYRIYAILMDRADKLTRNEKIVIDILCNLGGDFGKNALGGFGKYSKKNNAHTLGDVNLKEEIQLYQRETGKKVNISDKEIKKIFNDYIKMRISLENNGISTQDIHEGNVGYFKGKMVHFDIMDDSKNKDIDKISKFKV
jgi:hypothetical protein